MTVAERMEQSWLDTFWVPPDVEVVDVGELKLLRCDRDHLPYNMVLRLPREDLDGAVAEIQRAHRSRRSRVLVFGVRPDADEALRRGGYTASIHHHGWVIEAKDHRPRPHPRIEWREVVDMAGLEAMLAVNDEAFGESPKRTHAEKALFLDDCTGPGRRVLRVVAWEGDRALSSGGVTLHPKLDLGLLWAGGTVPDGRRRGAYSAVLEGRIHATAAVGISAVGVYARDDTSGPVVESQGFTRLEPMVAWERG